MMKISDQSVKTAKIPESGQAITWDDDVKGYGLRVTAGGAKSFIFNYRINGRSRRMTIGQYPAWSVAAARKRAGDLRKAVDRGDDPMGARHEQRAAPTVKDLCDRYEEEHLPRKRVASQRNDKAAIANTIRPALGTTKVQAVTFADIDGLHRKMKATPYKANRTLALLSKMFSLSIRWGIRKDNPCRGVERFQESRRERYLTADERGRLLVAMQEAGADEKNAARKAEIARTVNAFRLAMLTGCRIGEALGATWEQFDIEGSVWTKPAATTKQKKDHKTYLNAPARALLADMVTGKSKGWLFPSRTGEGHQTNYRHTWQAVRDVAMIPDLRVHDLRHNFASEGASVGLSLPMIGALLGHTNPATTARYAHLMADPLKQAAEAIGSRLAGDERAAK
jgi:integrase